MKTARTLSRLLLALAGLVFGGEALAIGGNPITGVSLATSLNDAHALVGNRADLKVLRVEGDSMLPFFGPGAVIVVKTLAPDKIRAGMVVVYTNRFGETIAHRLVGATEAGWTASGYNNDRADSTAVTADNLVGVVYATFHSNARPVDGRLLAAITAATPVALAAPAR